MRLNLFARLTLAIAVISGLSLAPAAMAGSYADAVTGLSPSHYYKLNEDDFNDFAADEVGGSDAEYVNATYDKNFLPIDDTDTRGGLPVNPGSRDQGWMGSFAPDTQLLVNRGGSPLGLPLAGFDSSDKSLFANNSTNVELGASDDFQDNTMTVSMWFKSTCNQADGTAVCFGPPASNGGERLFSTNQGGVDTGGVSDVDDSGHFQIDYGWGAGLVVSIDNRFNAPLKSNFQVAHGELITKNESWHHIVASRNGDVLFDDPTTTDVREGVTLVVDGVEITEDRWSNSTDSWGVTDAGTARIGGRAVAGTTDHTFSGWLSDFAMWLGDDGAGNAQVTVQEARVLYRAGLNQPNNGANLDAAGGVDAADAGIMFSNWGSADDPISDVVTDLTIDAADAGILFAEWTGDPNPAEPGSASAEYNYNTGNIGLTVNGAVNAYVESFSAGLAPGQANAAPDGALVTHNQFRSGLTGFEPLEVENWRSSIGPGHTQGDLTLKVTSALGSSVVTYRAGTEQFKYVPEPSSLGLCLMGLFGLMAVRRR